jgi:hypothetical protein
MNSQATSVTAWRLYRSAISARLIYLREERRSLDAAGSVNDNREAVSPIMAVAREAADTLAIPAHHQAAAVMLDFVNPERAGRWPRGLRRLARFDEAGGSLACLRAHAEDVGVDGRMARRSDAIIASASAAASKSTARYFSGS